jgi:hypothetical protein
MCFVRTRQVVGGVVVRHSAQPGLRLPVIAGRPNSKVSTLYGSNASDVAVSIYDERVYSSHLSIRFTTVLGTGAVRNAQRAPQQRYVLLSIYVHTLSKDPIFSALLYVAWIDDRIVVRIHADETSKSTKKVRSSVAATNGLGLPHCCIRRPSPSRRPALLHFTAGPYSHCNLPAELL